MTVADDANKGGAQDGADNTNNEYQNPNDLGTEMSDEELESFVNGNLGLGEADDENKTSEDDKPDDSGDDKDDSKAEDDKSEVDDESKSGDDSQNEEDEDDVSEQNDTSDTKQGSEDDKSTAELDKDDSKIDENGIQTDDLWVEVDRLVETEDGKTKTEKVKLTYDPQNPNAFLPDDFKFTSEKQLFEVLEAKREMEELYKQRESELNEKTEQQTAAEERKAQLDAWDAEVQDLIDDGELEAPKKKAGEDGWKDDPSVQKIDAVFKYMASTNEKRVKEGKPPIKSFQSAFRKYGKEQAEKEAKEQAKKDTADAKKKSSLIGGSSASGSEAGKSYVAGSKSNIWEVDVDA